MIFIIPVFIFVIILFIVYSTENNNKNTNEKNYHYERVGYDHDKMRAAEMDVMLGKLSRQEHIKREKQGYYSIIALVENGKPAYTWKQEAVNRETYLRYASDNEKLPQYLQDETGFTYVREYRKSIK